MLVYSHLSVQQVPVVLSRWNNLHCQSVSQDTILDSKYSESSSGTDDSFVYGKS